MANMSVNHLVTVGPGKINEQGHHVSTVRRMHEPPTNRVIWLWLKICAAVLQEKETA